MKTVQSTMAGTVLEILVGNGDRVEAGQDVAILESMKMEVPVQAEETGIVASVKTEVGAFVSDGDVLIELKDE
ncbi:acetyl-CoA carboxylase biotin carboxyl carrier protein subunit [Paludifilum halophilum]|uniref:Acetyl-CoA carboxylase biotin carboxyl carrier protein subunit n=1 Tax=Paludifilum halophilum TaxID=1642702 RepID=A0A235B6F1_9BACL|nr:acetyl-CoA carboxylase biotin carboxyl carrier protein subunit [Paludifilum halophilum]OYD07878.1 acetyl-CoA carboxylase biotin carboxyl carrier protein subunit [Paludifilum halophilum]